MKKIIVAPLNWGLGHATRCVPIINSLIINNFTPIIASDGSALAFLKKEFPKLEFLELPSYDISYAKNLKWNLILQFPKIIKAVKKERIFIENFIQKDKNVIGLISDNRFGIRSSLVSSIYMTHQINVLSGFSTFLTSKIHQNIIKKFDQCWVPDDEKSTFSGKLSQVDKSKFNVKFIGVLSRFKKREIDQHIDVLVILSGVEPNRTQLENKLREELESYHGSIVFIQGKIEKKQTILVEKKRKVYNFMLSEELEKFINQSKFVICRSGYSSIMDLAVLEKKAFLIPTENQGEQEYLADYLKENHDVFYSPEKKFKKELLQKVLKSKALKAKIKSIDSDLFSFFKRK